MHEGKKDIVDQFITLLKKGINWRNEAHSTALPQKMVGLFIVLPAGGVGPPSWGYESHALTVELRRPGLTVRLVIPYRPIIACVIARSQTTKQSKSWIAARPLDRLGVARNDTCKGLLRLLFPVSDLQFLVSRVRDVGIGPALRAWQARVLPLYESRLVVPRHHTNYVFKLSIILFRSCA